MILVDASVWIDHIRAADEGLSRLLLDGRVLSHPFVIGEIALGHLRNRDRVLPELQKLPQVEVATDAEVLGCIDRWKLFGQGVGYVDTHLLASTMLAPGCKLWTRDKRLLAVATKLRLNASV